MNSAFGLLPWKQMHVQCFLQEYHLTKTRKNETQWHCLKSFGEFTIVDVQKSSLALRLIVKCFSRSLSDFPGANSRLEFWHPTSSSHPLVLCFIIFRPTNEPWYHPSPLPSHLHIVAHLPTFYLLVKDQVAHVFIVDPTRSLIFRLVL